MLVHGYFRNHSTPGDSYGRKRLFFTAATATYGRELYVLNSAHRISPSRITFINENVPIGTQVGLITAADPDAGDTITFSLPNGIGNNSAFAIVGKPYKPLAQSTSKTNASLNITVRATITWAPFADQTFVIQVNNLAELGAPVQIGSGGISRSVVRQLVVDLMPMYSSIQRVPAAEAHDRQCSPVLDTVTTSFALATLPNGATRATLSFSGVQTYTEVRCPMATIN